MHGKPQNTAKCPLCTGEGQKTALDCDTVSQASGFVVRLRCGFDFRKFRIVFFRGPLDFRSKPVGVGGRFGFVFFFRLSSGNQPRGKTAEKRGQRFPNHLRMLIFRRQEIGDFL